MIQTVLSVILGFTIIITGWCIPFFFRNVNEYKKEMQSLFCISWIATLFYLITISTTDRFFATLFYSFYFCMLDWSLIRMLEYTMEYTGIHMYSQFVLRISKILLALDVILLLLNVQFENVFLLEKFFYKDSDIIYWSNTFFTPFLYHLVVCYILVGLIVNLFIQKIRQSPKAYRKMYSYILFFFVLIIFADLWFYFHDFFFHIGIFLYSFLGITIYYFTYIAIPKGIREDSMIQIVEDISSGIICFDADGKCRYLNKAIRNIFCEEPEHIYETVERIHKNFEETYDTSDVKIMTFKDVILEIDGKPKHFDIEYQKLCDKKDRLIGFFYKFEDCTEEILLLQKEEYLASHDSLTNMYNREYFFAQMEKILKEDPDTPRYLVCTNIRHFKLVNELFGEETGDKVLKEQAKALMMANYDTCIHGRISADRYAMLIPKQYFNPDLAMRNTKKLQNLLNDYNFVLRIMICVYEINDVTESVKVMYDKANFALSHNNNDYDQIVIFYNNELMNQIIHETKILNSFEEALAHKEICMYLQPQFNQKKEVIGCEAVARWMHPTYGILVTNDFIDTLEKTGAVVKLDQYIWEEAVKKLAEWKEKGICHIPISINLSPADFIALDLCQYISGLVTRYGVKPSLLRLEITEKLFKEESERNMSVIRRLQEFGFSVEIDDFGRGYSSLNLLKDMNINKLKVDMVFLHESLFEDRREIILESICEMANNLNMPLIMEGVENEIQFQMLKELSCQFFQGSYFSLPIPVEEFEEKYIYT